MIAEVSHIFQEGISLSLRDQELFLSHNNFSWFKDASVAAIQNVELLNERHLYWRLISMSIFRLNRSNIQNVFRSLPDETHILHAESVK